MKLNPMPVTDLDIATLCNGIYATPGTPPVVWDYLDPGDDDGICWGLKRVEAFDIIILRGSVVLKDWIRDLRADSILTSLGMVHAGFYAGMEFMWDDVRPLLTQPRTIVGGHSLGAARAGLLCGIMTQAGKAPAARIVFGEPKPGFVELAKIIAGTPGRSYRNGDNRHHDLVTDLAFSFPPFQYVHPTPIIPVTARPADETFADLGVFGWHHAPLYVAALTAMNDAPIIG